MKMENNQAGISYISCNILNDIRLHWHIHIDCADNVAQLTRFDLKDSFNKDRVACKNSHDLELCAHEAGNLPERLLHRRCAFCSTTSRNFLSLIKYMFEYWCLYEILELSIRKEGVVAVGGRTDVDCRLKVGGTVLCAPY